MSDQVAAAEPTPQPRDPWDRFGWVMGTVWLLFLAFPLAAIVSGTFPLWVKVASVSCILVFGVTYVHGLVRMHEDDTWTGPTGHGVRHVAALTALTVATAALVGETALGMATFIVAFAMFALPLRVAVALMLAAITITAAMPWVLQSFSHAWYVAPVVLTVGVFAGVARILDGRQAKYRTMADEIAMGAERDRVSRDVHDVLGHSLTVVTVKAELAERLIDVDPVRARAELEEIQSITRQSLAEIRAIVAGLRVARLTEELESASKALAGAGIEAELPNDPSATDPRHRIVLAWALREAVTNVIRHSGAERCTITLGEDWLEVADDGRGIGDANEGHGMRGLRERVRGAGGTVAVVTPAADGGTTVRVQL